MTPPATKSSPLALPVATLWGVGPERAVQLNRLDIHTVEDLLLHRPRRYEDRRNFRPIARLTPEEPALTRGTVVAVGLKRFRKGSRSVVELVLDDGTARLHCRWWNLPFMENYFAVGDEVVAYGKPVSLKPRTMDHPETEVVEPGEESFIHFNRIVPIYPLTEGLPQRWLRGLIWRALQNHESHITDPWPKINFQSPPDQRPIEPPTHAQSQAPDTRYPTPDTLLPSRSNAVHMIHFPEALSDIEYARRRLALDEFIALQLQVRQRRKVFESRSKSLPCAGDNHLIKPFLARLGFKLTDSQTSVLREIRHDMGAAHPMRRLLQGDVGSGKTVVAACTALMALESGYNVALMAPTEILAEQHFQNFQRWLTPLGIGVQMQTGSRKTALSGHSATLFIGTHALLEDSVAIPKLGLVIIDEQHKFGVAQREQLVRKGNYPHLLVMTATPIPRTLGLTLYGDLDVSTIDKAPAGRGSVKTYIRTAKTLPKVREFMRQKLKEGRQACVVYPRVEDTGAGLKAVTAEFEKLQKLLAPFKVGLLHGRVKPADKEAVMTAFRDNKVNVLLATPLIEVGVDVPNATVMLIENAEVFGLAQLHQLRGRIGRGAHESHCILISDAETPESRRRLKILEETNDGFRIAEEDLKLRGPGELLGQQQSGAPSFRFGDLVEDLDLIRRARELSAHLLQA